jgi:hypothetical protein
VPPDAPFDGVGFVLEPVHLLPEFFKAHTLFGDVALDGLLKGPSAFFDLFRMLLQADKGRCHKHGKKWYSHDLGLL